MIESLEVSAPVDASEQCAIAHVLGTLDDKSDLNRRMNEILEEMARALFKSWFVDFEPVRAKMEGRWRRGHALPGMSADLHGLPRADAAYILYTYPIVRRHDKAPFTHRCTNSTLPPALTVGATSPPVRQLLPV